MSKNLTVEQIEKIVVDTGVVYLNFGLEGEKILAPCKGDNAFTVEQEIKDIEFNGRRGKTKGLRRVVSENASLTVNIMNLSQDNIKLALAGSIQDEAGAITNGPGAIADTEYFRNVTLVGDTLDGHTKVISLYNAISDSGLTVTMTDKDETAVQLTFAAHYDPANLKAPIYKIDEAAPVGTYTVTFIVSDGVDAIQGATVAFNGTERITDVNGEATFTVYAGNNKPYTVIKSGYATVNSAVDVDSADVSETVTMTAI